MLVNSKQEIHYRTKTLCGRSPSCKSKQQPRNRRANKKQLETCQLYNSHPDKNRPLHNAKNQKLKDEKLYLNPSPSGQKCYSWHVMNRFFRKSLVQSFFSLFVFELLFWKKITTKHFMLKFIVGAKYPCYLLFISITKEASVSEIYR